MSYLNGKPPLNLANYVKVKGTILSSNMASFNHKNNILTCRYLTEFDDSCISSYTCRKKKEFYYPIRSNTTLLYLPSSGYCRTKQFTNNLAYIGSSFLGLCILFCIGSCIYLRNKTGYYQILNQDELIPSNDCKYVKIYDVDFCSVCNEQFNENKYVLKKCIDIWLNKKIIVHYVKKIKQSIKQLFMYNYFIDNLQFIEFTFIIVSFNRISHLDHHNCTFCKFLEFFDYFNCFIVVFIWI